MKLLAKVFSVVALVVVVIFLTCLWIYRDIPAHELEAKYAEPPSRFVEVEGIRYHVRQEGSGPDALLLHASFGNLFMWDGWVENLSDQYRFTRIDLVAHGLTGSGPEESYSTDELAESLHGLLAELELDSFHLVGTSIGGILAFTYAADYPDQVTSLTLMNSAGLIHRGVNPNPVQRSVPLKYRLLARITPRYLMDDFFRSLIHIEENATPEVLQTYYDMIMHEGNRQATLSGMRDYQPRDPSPWLTKIIAPTFVMWAENSVLPQHEAEEFIDLLEGTPSTQTLIIEEGGHALPISHPISSSEAASAFWAQVGREAVSDANQ